MRLNPRLNACVFDAGRATKELKLPVLMRNLAEILRGTFEQEDRLPFIRQPRTLEEHTNQAAEATLRGLLALGTDPA